MPFYEYQCKQCGHHLEAMQKLSDQPLKKCPACGKSALSRLMSAPVFRLKGGGWYETDFKSDQEGKRNLADRPEAEAAKNDKAADAKADAKAQDKSTDNTSASKEAAAKDAGSDAAKSADQSAEPPAGKPAAKPAKKHATKPTMKKTKRTASRR